MRQPAQNQRAAAVKGSKTRGASIIALDRFIQATRDSGYKDTASALAELVDNALQAKAKHVEISIRESDDPRWPLKVVVRDDGCGMDRPTLQQSLRFGGSTRFNNRGGLGRYGMGLPNSSLSQAQRVTVYTWQARGEVVATHLDVDDIASGQLTDVPAPRKARYPLPGRMTRRGTIVIWSRCDRLDFKQPSTLARRLLPALGRRFRHYIWRGVKITVNDQLVPAVDPLCLHENSVVNGATPFGEPIEYEVRVDPADPRSPSGSVTIRFSELPVHEWHDLPNKEKQRRGVSKGAGVSVVRGGREVDYGWFFLVGKRRENYDDWWRCEIQFDPILDEAFGITHTKQQIRPQPHLVEAIAPDMESIARALNTRARKAHLAVKALERFAESESVARESDSVLPPIELKPTHADRRLLTELTKSNPELRGSPSPRNGDGNAGLDYRVIESGIKGTNFFDFVRRDGQLVLVINQAHPFYRLVYKPLLESDTPRERQIRTHLDLVLLAAARGEAANRNRQDAGLLQEHRQQWSAALAAFLVGAP